MSDYGDKCMDAMTCDGNRIRQAWLMARACYAYTRSWDGVDGMEFGRWYSLKCAVDLGWEYLWRKP